MYIHVHVGAAGDGKNNGWREGLWERQSGSPREVCYKTHTHALLHSLFRNTGHKLLEIRVLHHRPLSGFFRQNRLNNLDSSTVFHNLHVNTHAHTHTHTHGDLSLWLELRFLFLGESIASLERLFTPLRNPEICTKRICTCSSLLLLVHYCCVFNPSWKLS